MRHKQTIYWREILWPRPFSEDAERAVLTHLATLGLNTQIIFEARAAKGKIRWLVGAEPVALSKVMAALKAELPAIRFETKAVTSDYQAYRQAGNSVTVPVIETIGKRIKNLNNTLAHPVSVR